MNHKDFDLTSEVEEWAFGSSGLALSGDDLSVAEMLRDRLPQFVEMLTRIGGEVSRLRADADGLIEQNARLREQFEKLQRVIQEKGLLDLDDFELACEVFAAADESRTNKTNKKTN